MYRYKSRYKVYWGVLHGICTKDVKWPWPRVCGARKTLTCLNNTQATFICCKLKNYKQLGPVVEPHLRLESFFLFVDDISK